ncbi:MAG TPA: hypothetical protein VF839_13515 [Clostridium sp.]
MKRKIALVLLAGAVLSAGVGVYAHAETTPVAYVSVDINPSVELGMNAFNRVVSVEAYNDDGKKIIEGTDLKNYGISNAINTLVSHAISEGYIKEDGTSAIEITTTTDKEDVAAELDESLNEVADKALNDNDIEATVETENVALARRDEARKLGITPGKLNLIQKLQALDPTITVEDYKSSSVKDIQKKAKELREMNKNEEATTTTDSKTTTDVNAESDVNTETNNEDAITEEKANDASTTNGNAIKEEKSNPNSKVEDNNAINDKEKNNIAKSEKQNNGNNSNSQNNSDLGQQNKNNNKEKNKNN